MRQHKKTICRDVWRRVLFPALVLSLNLMALLLSGDTLRSRVALTFLVRTNSVGYIIGKQGAKINAIRFETGADILVSREEFSIDGGTLRTCEKHLRFIEF